MTFTGFPADAFAFYAELDQVQQGDPARARQWWQANKPRYESSVREPAEALAAELADEFGSLKIFRPYKDVRFSADKRPYKDHLGMVSTDVSRTAHYFQLSERGVMIGGGLYQPSREQLARFREIVDDVRAAGDLEAAVEAATDAGFTLMTEGAVATAPRGYRVDHPRIGLLRLTHLAVGRSHDVESWMSSPEFAERVREGWRVVSAWNAWLDENLPAAVERARR
jgi:uncharacterized protein (TIGR02453 family)